MRGSKAIKKISTVNHCSAACCMSGPTAQGRTSEAVQVGIDGQLSGEPVRALAGPPPWSHDVAEDDCRVQDYTTCLYGASSGRIWWGAGRFCFYTQAINAAEIIFNEAQSERVGAQDMVG